MMKAQQAKDNLKRINDNYVRSDILKQVNNKIWDYSEFVQWPGSIGKHHSYEGGLVIHTEEVWRYALNTSAEFDADLDVLFAAILWHDLAKIFDYKELNEKDEIYYEFIDDKEPIRITKKGQRWTKSDYHSHIHHITGSIAEFTRHALNLELDRCTLEKIQHCMAGHHGFPEFRSPVTPKSIEAIILHYSDMLSATHGKTK